MAKGTGMFRRRRHDAPVVASSIPELTPEQVFDLLEQPSRRRDRRTRQLDPGPTHGCRHRRDLPRHAHAPDRVRADAGPAGRAVGPARRAGSRSLPPCPGFPPPSPSGQSATSSSSPRRRSANSSTPPTRTRTRSFLPGTSPSPRVSSPDPFRHPDLDREPAPPSRSRTKTWPRSCTRMPASDPADFLV